MCRTYVGVAYGNFVPSSKGFSYLLPVSVSVSLLGAGSTAYSFEALFRSEQRPADRDALKVGTRYGTTAVLLRTAQMAALVFWIALLACAEKGSALFAAVLSVMVFGFATVSAGVFETKQSCIKVIGMHMMHPALVGGMMAVFFSDESWLGWLGALMALCWILLACVCAIVIGFGGYMPTPRPRCCSCIGIVLMLFGVKLFDWFINTEHIQLNNYANKTLPPGGPVSASIKD